MISPSRSILLLSGLFSALVASGVSLPFGGAAGTGADGDRLTGGGGLATAAAAEPPRHRRDGVRRTGLPIPRFVSLRSSKVNLRTGPGVRYPVDWVYRRHGLPVMIIAEFDAWRKIRDWRGTVGWIHRSMLAGKRTVIATAREVILRRGPAVDTPAVARTEAGVIARVLTCDGDWCRVQAGGIRGWTQRRGLWGTLPDERIE